MVNAEARGAYNASMPSLKILGPSSDPPASQEPSTLGPVLLGWLPCLLLAAFAFELGTFPGAARANQTIVGHLLLLAVWVSALRSWDWGQQLPSRIWGMILLGTALLVGSSLSSPVPRAGWTGLSLLPAWVCVPLWMATCWRGPRALMWGLRGLAVVLASVSVWALVLRGGSAAGPAAMPLGHHNLLAAFLLPLLGMVSVLGSIGNRRIFWDRALAITSLALGVVALMATGSLAGGIALLVMASVVVLLKIVGEKGGQDNVTAVGRWVVLGSFSVFTFLALGLLTHQYDRIQSLWSGTDTSLQARMTYWQAGLSGFSERPWWGWGPGSSHWTLSQHLDPRPGINPSGQVVADLHSFPLQILYELGLLGCLGAALLLAGLFSAVRSRGVGRWQDLSSGSLFAGAAGGLIGVGVFSLSGFSLDVPALPMALMPCLAVLVGAPAPGFQARVDLGAKPLKMGRVFKVLAWSSVISLAAWQGSRDLAHWYYDQALRDEEARPTALRTALALDPHFPLYAWQLSQEEPAPELAWRAAESARGLAVFWLTAGDQQEDNALRVEAWRLASALDPLSAPAYFRLATAESSAGAGTRERRLWAAKALLLEPLLVAAVPWHETDGLLLEVAQELAGDPSLNVYWRHRLLDLAHKRRPVTEPTTMGLKLDAVPSESLSLFAFRRQPWPRIVTRIALDPELVSSVDLFPDPVGADRIR